MKNYELLLILKPTLTEEEQNNKVALIKELIEKNSGEIAAISQMGTRRLAYIVDKFERGVYNIFYFKAPSSSIHEIERIIRINEEVIKFMTVKFEKTKEIAHWEKQVSELNKQEEKQEEKPKQEEPKAQEAKVEKEEPEAQEAKTEEE